MDALDPFVFAGLFALALVPAIINVVRGRQAHSRPMQVAGDALRAGYLAVIFLACFLPASSVARSVTFVVAYLLGVWGIWTDVRDWRRSKVTGNSGAGTVDLR